MPEPPKVPALEDPPLDELVAELRLLRERGLVRLRHSELPCLRRAASRVPAAASQGPSAVETLLRAAVANLGGGDLGAAAAATFGLARGARDMAAADRRRRAALAYRVSVERFRKHHERIVLEQVGEEILKLCQAPPQPVARKAADFARQIVLNGEIGGSAIPIVVHVEPVELLVGVDIIVVPENVYLELPQRYKSSVSAAVLNAAAIRSPSGQIVADVIASELQSWLEVHGQPGLTVAPGTVVPTSPGKLADQGIRRIYHAALASPRPGTNYYDVDPSVIAKSVRRVMALAREEQQLFKPELRSVGFPLLGAGRGGVDPALSFAWLWAALEKDIRENGPWQLHFITRRRDVAGLIVSKLAEEGIISQPARPPGIHGTENRDGAE